MEAHKNLETQYSHCEPAGSKPTGPSTHQPGHLLGLSAANALPPWGTQGRKILSEVPVSQQKHTTVRCQYVRSGFPAAKRTPSVPKQPGLLCVSKRRAEIHNQNNIILPSWISVSSLTADVTFSLASPEAPLFMNVPSKNRDSSHSSLLSRVKRGGRINAV